MKDDEEFLEELQRVLDYNPEAGEFRWKVDVAHNVKAGSIAGNVSKGDGRLYIRFKRKLHNAHRLAWLLIYGKWPEQVIDHIDGNPLNNRIDNLRDVSRTVNAQNQLRPHSDSTSRFLGVSWRKDRQKFCVRIKISDKHKHLGYFLTAEAAHAAYLAAKRELHEGCTI